MLVRSPALALRLPVNYGRVSSWEFQRSLFASAQLGWLEGSLFALGSGTCVQIVNICLRAARGSKESIEDGPLPKRGQRWSSPSTLLSHQGCSEAQFTIKRWISVIWRLRHRGGVARGLPRMSKPRGRARDLDSILINSALGSR